MSFRFGALCFASGAATATLAIYTWIDNLFGQLLGF